MGATAAVNYIMGTICLRTGRRNNSIPLISSGRHLQTDTWSTLGIIAGLILLFLTKQTWIDGAVAIIFACLIMYTGYKIIRTSIAGIMDEADLALLKKLVELLNHHRPENWIDLHNLRIIKYGDTLHMDCHLTVPWYLNVRQAHDEVEALALLVKTEYSESIELFVHSDGCMEYSCRICSKQSCLVRLHEFEKEIEWTIDNISRDSKHRLAKIELTLSE